MDFKNIEQKWIKYWEDNNTFKTDVWDFSKPKFYALDMFPYPSGVGLHAGHPEGYTATDIVSRMKKMQGFNVLHPMGFDSFGLPAEQYAIKTGNHPGIFTDENIKTFTSQLKMLGFSYDWDRVVSTSDPKFYKWTQWIFKKLYEDGLAKLVEMPVNWCEELGTVLANDEVIDGKSERGGYPVVRKNMKQWVIDIPKYAEKLLKGLDDIDWPESTKEIQRNWIGKSIGAEVTFKINNTDFDFTVFTTRCDTLFGATYCVLAPEHDLVKKITTKDKINDVNKYIEECSKKSEIERTELNKDKTGIFTGAYAINPVNDNLIPIFISDYVLASYGTGAIMAVPAHDERDYEFAKKFNIPIIQVLEETIGQKHDGEINKDSYIAFLYDEQNKKYLLIDNKVIFGEIKEGESIDYLAKRNIEEQTGLSDIEFVREAFKINYHYILDENTYINSNVTPLLFKTNNNENIIKDNIVWLDEKEVEKELKNELYKKSFEYIVNDSAMTGDGIHINSGILNGLYKNDAINNMVEWLENNNYGRKKVNYRLREWIFARQRYWGEPVPIVHLEDGSTASIDDSELPLILPELEDYSPSKTGASPLDRKEDWVNVTYKGKNAKRETSTMPGSAGSSWYFLRYLDPDNENEIANKELIDHWMPVDLYVGGPEHAVGHLLYSRMWNNYLYDKGIVNVPEPFKRLVHQGMILGSNGIKMGKRYPEYSINPNDIVSKYGADTLRLYEMFMGPIEADKPWSNTGVEGAKRFLERVWRLYTEENKEEKTNPNLDKIYNQTVKKVTNDYETLNFNTAISQMMIFINSVYKENSFPKDYKEGFIKLLNPIAPFITEEIWNMMGHEETIACEPWPEYDEEKVKEDTVTIGIQVNGKVRASIEIGVNDNAEEILKKAMLEENVLKYIDNKEIIKKIVIPGKIVNIVVK